MAGLLHLLAAVDFLDWWALAALLALADVILPRARLLAPAIAAGILGFALMLFPQIAWGPQLAVFLLLAAAGLFAYRLQGYRQRMTGSGRRDTMASFYDFSVKSIDGSPKSLKDYRGRPVLVVNVASKCGLTPQYSGLEKLYREFKGKGLTVLGLPCNQFGGQEPGTEQDIQQFCSLNYDVSFPLTSKIEVNGAGTDPLYAWLKGASGGGDIQWNFEKFLIGKHGQVVKRYSPKTTPEDTTLRADIQAAL